MDLKETTKLENKIFDGKVIRVFCDDITLPNGEDAKREYVSHNGGVSILPIDDEGNVYLVRQYRYAYREELLEIPAGKMEKGEDPKECGLRELSEEIGATAKEFTHLSEFYPTVGYSNEIIYIYLAKGLEFAEMHLDEDEFLNVEKYPFDKVFDMVMNGEIKDSKTVLAVLKYKLLVG